MMRIISSSTTKAIKKSNTTIRMSSITTKVKKNKGSNTTMNREITDTKISTIEVVIKVITGIMVDRMASNIRVLHNLTEVKCSINNIKLKLTMNITMLSNMVVVNNTNKTLKKNRGYKMTLDNKTLAILME